MVLMLKVRGAVKWGSADTAGSACGPAEGLTGPTELSVPIIEPLSVTLKFYSGSTN